MIKLNFEILSFFQRFYHLGLNECGVQNRPSFNMVSARYSTWPMASKVETMKDEKCFEAT